MTCYCVHVDANLVFSALLKWHLLTIVQPILFSFSSLLDVDKHHAARLYEALLAESIDEIAILTRLFSEGKLSTDFLDKLCDMANVGLGAQHQVKTDLLRALQKLTDECDQRLGASMAGGSAAPAVVVPPKELVRVLSKYCQSLPGEKMNAAGLGKFYGEYPELKSNDVRIKTLCQDHPSLLTWIDDDTAHGKGWICAASRPPLPLKGSSCDNDSRYPDFLHSVLLSNEKTSDCAPHPLLTSL